MASDRELKIRIKSVQGIGQLTKAMKMVASAQLRKVETRSRAAKPYTERLKAVVGELAAQVSDAKNPLMVPHKKAEQGSLRTAVIVIGSDNGLCGSYNSTIFKFAENALAKNPPLKFIALGKKAVRFFEKRGFNIDYAVNSWHPDYKLGKELCERCCHWYLNEEVDEVHIYYTEALTMVKCEPRRLRLLPLAAEHIQSAEPGPAAGIIDKEIDYLFEPSADEALNVIIPNYIRIMMQQILLESKTSELGSRLTAMSNATENADELARQLTLEYYRIRQNNITTEIIEIASGAEALA
ncbi:MAG: ATP synthase F1 subunit gamma [bacterium]|nr:ATP synthase F1 subunit gamma [bacterium]